MPDDPDARLDAAEPPEEPLIEAAPMSRPSGSAPYHDAIAPELLDDLHLAIGKGLALVEARESSKPAAIVDAIASYIDAVKTGARRLPADVTDASLALGCLLGHMLCRELGWGWAHVRRTRQPGILVISPDQRYAAAPRSVIERALGGEGGSAVREYAERLRAGELPDSASGRYLRLG